MKKRLLIPLCLLGFAAPAAAGTTLTVLHTGPTNGVLETCATCPTRLNGGLARRAAEVKRIRAASGGVLLLDAGDFSPLLGEKELALIMADEMRRMGYDACSPGEQEFLHGLDFFRQMEAKAGFPFLSATLSGNPDGGPFCRASLVKEIGGIRVAVVGATSPRVFRYFDREVVLPGLAPDPAAAIGSLARALRPSANLLILLFHGDREESERLARDVPGFDLVVSGHGREEAREASRIGGALVVSAGRNGERLGEVVFTLDGDRKAAASSARLILLDNKVPEDAATLLRVRNAVAEKDRRSGLEMWAAKAREGAANGPALAPERWEIALGEMAAGTRRRVRVVLANPGAAPLIVRRLRCSCECMTARLDRMEIPPRGRATLSVTFNTAGVSGAFTDRIYLETNIPSAPVVWLLVTGTVKPKAAALPVPRATAEAADRETRPEPLVAEVFSSPGCPQCARLKEEFFPEVAGRFRTRVAIVHRDISRPEDYAALVKLETSHGLAQTAPVELFVGDRALVGSDAIRRDLENVLAELLREGRRGLPATSPETEPVPAPRGGAEARRVIGERFRSFSALAVMAAGLADGVNPCAFATIVFLVSVLASLKRSRGEILLTGLGFTLGVFCAYLGLGAGLLAGLRSLTGMRVLSRVITGAIALFALALGVVSLRDARAYRARRDSSSVILQLPAPLKRVVHRLLKTGLGARRLFWGSLGVGAAVSLVEAVCTGQVYLPTIGFMTREPALAAKAWLFLLAYNLCFILPLVVVFILVSWGVGWRGFSRALERNLVLVKVLTGVLFVGLGVLLLAL